MSRHTQLGSGSLSCNDLILPLLAQSYSCRCAWMGEGGVVSHHSNLHAENWGRFVAMYHIRPSSMGVVGCRVACRLWSWSFRVGLGPPSGSSFQRGRLRWPCLGRVPASRRRTAAAARSHRAYRVSRKFLVRNVHAASRPRRWAGWVDLGRVLVGTQDAVFKLVRLTYASRRTPRALDRASRE